MKKAELINNVQAKVEGATKKNIEAIFDAYAEVVLETLRDNKEEDIPLFGIGTFKTKHVDAKEGIIQMGDKKGEKWTKDAHDEITFKITRSVKNL